MADDLETSEDVDYSTVSFTSYQENTQTMILMLSIVIGVLVVLLFIMVYMQLKRKSRAPPAPQQPRFRKRDKVRFYAKKFMRPLVRKMSSVPRPPRLRRKDYDTFVKRIQEILKNEDIGRKPRLEEKEPPAAVLEPDLRELQLPPEFRIPSEVLYMLKNIRVFGHFERPLFLELCQNIETRFVPAGGFLFRPGHSDDSIFVVQSGKLILYISESDGLEFSVKEVTQGESIHSLLSIMDVITGHTACYKTVSAKAVMDTTVLRLPAKAFQKVFQNNPESMVRVVQMMMIRLQRVTFETLQNLLGLMPECINPEQTSDRTLAIHRLYHPDKRPSPSHTRFRHRSASQVYTASSLSMNHEQKAPQEDQRMTKSDASDSDAEHKFGATCDSAPETGSKRSTRKLVRAMTVGPDYAGKLSMSTSDFEVAAGRARVPGLDEIKEHNVLPETPSEYLPKLHSTSETQPSDEDILDLARMDLMKILGLKDEATLKDHIHLAHIPAGSVLAQEGDKEVSLLYLVSGTLSMTQSSDSNKETYCYTAWPGDMIGEIAVLTGEPVLFTVKARQDCTVVAMSKKSIYSIIHDRPQVVLKIGHYVVQKLSPFVRQTDFALDWMSLEAGKAVYRQGEKADCTYIVLNGRLRSVVTLPSGKKDLVGEYGRGDIVGIIEVLTQTDRVTSVHAIRDTEVAKLPSGMLSLIKRKYPKTVTRLIEILGQRLLGQFQEKIGSRSLKSEVLPTVENLSTVALVAVSSDVPLSRFALELTHALSSIGPVLRLTENYILQTLGGSALDSMHEYRLTSWLAQQEDLHRIVLFQANNGITAWTQRCIRQADCILIVGLADSDPTNVGDLEKELEGLAVRAQKELILLHKKQTDGTYKEPTRTADWLNSRGWCVSHHHIRCPSRMFKRMSPGKERENYNKLSTGQWRPAPDFGRLARFLTGTSVGLVLGGGGARGIAHYGVLTAMEEYGIPVDMIGGTSIGSYVGALYSHTVSVSAMEKPFQRFCQNMGSIWGMVVDLTYPYTAMFSGRSFNWNIKETFKDKQIEDLWIPYFSITTDITDSKIRVHRSGSLWRYVRGSMSLSGYLPPLCDPKDGHLLLDGGYVNNLPADVMKSLGAQTIIAIDVGSQDDMSLTNYGDDLSGWWLLWKKWNPWTSRIRVPDLSEVQSRLAYISCSRLLEEVKSNECFEYIRPPIDRYKTLHFHKFKEIKDIGYEVGKTVFEGWKKSGRLDELCKERNTKHRHGTQSKHYQVHNTFSNLAAMVSRLEPSQHTTDEYETDGVVDSSSETQIETVTSVNLPNKVSSALSEDNEDSELESAVHDANDGLRFRGKESKS